MDLIEAKRNFFRDKVRACIVPTTSPPKREDPNFHYNWTVGTKELQCIQGVCRFAFCNVYGIGHTYLESLCLEIKDGVKISKQV